MKLIGINASGFRSLSEVSISCNNLTVLIGENDSG
jgi:predicted ATP-dependent endonuclease of OLD family